jgi:uncharacterized protein (TIGR03067 family)
MWILTELPQPTEIRRVVSRSSSETPSMTRSLCFALLFVVSLSILCRADDARDDAKLMNGTWLPSEAELAGEKFPDEVRKTITLVVADGEYTVTVGKQPDRGTIKLDPTTKPKSLDITGTEGPNKGNTILAIYEISDDTLRVCYDLSGKERPTEFKTTSGSPRFLVTYRRKKP